MYFAEKLCAQVQAARSLTPAEATRFFKTGPGDYGAHDRFIGTTVPMLRHIAQKAGDCELSAIVPLLRSEFNEIRFLGLLLLIKKFKNQPQEVFDCYIAERAHINNWNLVDLSAHHIVGAFLHNKPRDILFKLAQSCSLWDRRIAIVSSWFFIKKGDVRTTFELSLHLLSDKKDLMHKATGWMLREAGKIDKHTLSDFLFAHQYSMPRTMWRYATEKFSIEEKLALNHAAGRS